MNEETYISDFVHGRLPEPDHRAATERLKTDAAFAAAVAEYRDLQQAIRASETADLKTRLQRLEGTVTPVARRPLGGWRLMAAAIAILLAAGAVLIWMNSGTTPSALYAEHFEPYPNTAYPITRGGSLPAKAEIFALYEQGKYDQAIPAMEEAMAMLPNDTVAFFLGVSYMAVEEYANAREVLADEQYGWEQSVYAAERLWYLGLVHLKMGEAEWAENVLQKYIDNLEGAHKEQATAILEQL